VKQRGGYVLIARGLLTHPRFKPTGAFTNAEAWLWMINAAAFKPHSVVVMTGRQRRTIELQRGQFSHSVRFLAHAWNWSPGRVQRFLDALQTDTAIDTRSDTGQTVISLCNYEAYQGAADAIDTQTGTRSGEQTDTKKNQGIRNNDNKRSRAAASDDDFADWYAVFPRHTQPDAALRAYRKVIASGRINRADLKIRTKAFADDWARRLVRAPNEKQYIPYPASWLNKGGYLDRADSAGAPKAATPLPAKATAEFCEVDWLSCLSFQKRHDKWSGEWGPPPGAPGCLVPTNLLITPVTGAA
jgi:hypothetical protein